MKASARVRRFPFWSWVWFFLGVLYFVMPLYALLDFSLRMERDVIGLKAYASAFADKEFLQTFGYSFFLAAMTIIVSIILIVPTAYWIRLRLPEARRIVEFITLLPFVIPAIILVFGMIRIYSSPVNLPFTDIRLLAPLTTSRLGTNALIVAGQLRPRLPSLAPPFGPSLFLWGRPRAYEPAALTFTTFLLTWAAMGIIQLVTGGQGQVAGA